MMKRAELNREGSCWNKAMNYERLFILLERDAAAPAAIRRWIEKRIELGLNKPDDTQLMDAEHCASMMERDCGQIRREADLAKAQVGQGNTPLAQDGDRKS